MKQFALAISFVLAWGVGIAAQKVHRTDRAINAAVRLLEETGVKNVPLILPIDVEEYVALMHREPHKDTAGARRWMGPDKESLLDSYIYILKPVQAYQLSRQGDRTAVVILAGIIRHLMEEGRDKPRQATRVDALRVQIEFIDSIISRHSEFWTDPHLDHEKRGLRRWMDKCRKEHNDDCEKPVD